MIFNSNINLPQKSIFGFKILNSFQSSIACYLLLLTSRLLNPFFELINFELITGSLFNVVILTFNLFIKSTNFFKFAYLILLNFNLLKIHSNLNKFSGLTNVL